MREKGKKKERRETKTWSVFGCPGVSIAVKAVMCQSYAHDVSLIPMSGNVGGKEAITSPKAGTILICMYGFAFVL